VTIINFASVRRCLPPWATRYIPIERPPWGDVYWSADAPYLMPPLTLARVEFLVSTPVVFIGITPL
jgi:hypothetical protein